MIIGNKEIFAFEINECIPPSPILKDVFMWVDNKRIGNEAPYYSIYCSCAKSLLNKLKRKTLEFDELEGKTILEIYDLLNVILQGDTRCGFLTSEVIFNNLLIANWSDALDGWNIFLFENNQRYTIIWSPFESDEVFSKDIDKQYFISTFEKFIEYSKMQLEEEFN
jgi:hypothetical protein